MGEKSGAKLAGYWSVVTGASSGIGADFARQLAGLGSDVILTARRLDRLEKLAEEIRGKYGVKAECVKADLAEPGAAEALFKAAAKPDRRIGVLVNNAGLGSYGPFMERALDKHRDTLQVNCVALTELTWLFAGHMIAHKGPSYIVNVASIASFQPAPFFAVYSGTKGYVRQFSEALRYELRDTNVAVSCLCPGGTWTEFMEQAGQKVTEKGQAFMMSSEEVARIGIRGMFDRQGVVVTGLLNKLAVFLPRFIPSGLAVHMTHKAMTRSVSIETPPKS